MAQPTRPFITCHVLDTTTGRPAPSIPVTLRLDGFSNVTTSFTWTATTNADGRVTAWTPVADFDLNAVVAEIKGKLADSGTMRFALVFDSGKYFGEGKTFWPEVELKFWTLKGEEHYHVPLLLGPWSYTTYRGS